MAKSKKFRFPPLVEVAFEVRFKPKLKIAKGIPDYQDAISKKFPSYHKLNEASDQQAGGIDDGTGCIWVFESQTKKRKVRISEERFNVVVQDYASFAEFSVEIRSLWAKLKKIAGDLSYTRVGLRYINHLFLPMDGEKHQCEVYTNLHYDQERFEQDTIERIFLEGRLRMKATNLTVRSGIMGIRETETDRETAYLLDYDCYQDETSLTGEPESKLVPYHKIIETRFLSDLKEPYLEYMRRGEWK